MSAARQLDPLQELALILRGYDPDAAAAGVSGPPSTWTTAAGVLLRPHVCEIEGIEIDGHEGSDLDPNSTACIHCDYEGPNP